MIAGPQYLTMRYAAVQLVVFTATNSKPVAVVVIKGKTVRGPVERS